jgi:hypothetical protein
MEGGQRGLMDVAEPAGAPKAPPVDDHVFLIGRPPMGEFLAFVRVMAINGQKANQRQLAEEWRGANDHIRELEKREAGWADRPQIGPLPAALDELKARLLADPILQRSFQLVPTTVGVVELDRLVVFQKQINLAHVKALRDSLGNEPTPEEVFRFCLPFDHPQAPAQVMQMAGNAYTFISASNDFRFLDAQLFDPIQIIGYAPPGPVVGVLGLVVGYSSNFLHAVQVEDRLVLGNGSHRAYALRELGVTHVPCLIQHVSRREEIEVLGLGDIQKNADDYLKAPRPPVLKDYFDPALRKIIPVRRKLRQVRVTFGVEQVDIPAT